MEALRTDQVDPTILMVSLEHVGVASNEPTGEVVPFCHDQPLLDDDGGDTFTNHLGDSDSVLPRPWNWVLPLDRPRLSCHTSHFPIGAGTTMGTGAELPSGLPVGQCHG